MEQEERELTLETMKGLLSGIAELFTMVLDNIAPAGYQVIIKKSGTDDFCRERSITAEQPIKWSEAETKELDPDVVIIRKDKLQKIWERDKEKEYNKGYRAGYGYAKKQMQKDTNKAGKKQKNKEQGNEYE